MHMGKTTIKNGPVLFVSLGAPGSGKSYLATKLCKEYGIVHLRSDEVRKYVFPKPTYSPEENGRLFSLIDFFAEQFLASGVSVFYDANCTKRAFREKLRRVAKKHKAKYAVLWMQTPLELAIKRAKKRSFHPVDEIVVRGIHSEIEPPKDEPTVRIDGTSLYKIQKLSLMKFLK